MESFNKNKLNNLLLEAESYNEQAEIIKDAYKDMQLSKDGKATLYIYADGKTTKVDLGKKFMDDLLMTLYKCYKGLIQDTKRDIDELYRSFMQGL